MIEELPSPKLCKRCGKSAYSFRIGWEDNEGKVYWHKRRDWNYCKECRMLTYENIARKKKEKKHEA